jgi:hypothetical protein
MCLTTFGIHLEWKPLETSLSKCIQMWVWDSFLGWCFTLGSSGQKWSNMCQMPLGTWGFRSLSRLTGDSSGTWLAGSRTCWERDVDDETVVDTLTRTHGCATNQLNLPLEVYIGPSQTECWPFIKVGPVFPNRWGLLRLHRWQKTRTFIGLDNSKRRHRRHPEMTTYPQK